MFAEAEWDGPSPSQTISRGITHPFPSVKTKTTRTPDKLASKVDVPTPSKNLVSCDKMTEKSNVKRKTTTKRKKHLTVKSESSDQSCLIKKKRRKHDNANSKRTVSPSRQENGGESKLALSNNNNISVEKKSKKCKNKYMTVGVDKTVHEVVGCDVRRELALTSSLCDQQLKNEASEANAITQHSKRSKAAKRHRKLHAKKVKKLLSEAVNGESSSAVSVESDATNKSLPSVSSESSENTLEEVISFVNSKSSTDITSGKRRNGNKRKDPSSSGNITPASDNHITVETAGENFKKTEDDTSCSRAPGGTVASKLDLTRLKKVLDSRKSRESVAAVTDEQDRRPMSKQSKTPSLAEKMQDKLNAARFRYLNEQLYTTSSVEAKRLFSSDAAAFSSYHAGFTAQLNKWPEKPLDRVVNYIQQRSSSKVIADFGCGDAALARTLDNTVHSFDLVAINDDITACDMSNVPLGASSVDICVFCLSLMGTNLADFLCEANRVLKNNGTMLVAEVASRFDSPHKFVRQVQQIGFQLIKQDESNKFFLWFEFRKVKTCSQAGVRPTIQLAPCLYKKR